MQSYPISAGKRTVKVVAMGGGTGLSTLLHGLKHYVNSPDINAQQILPSITDLSAIVTVPGYNP